MPDAMRIMDHASGSITNIWANNPIAPIAVKAAKVRECPTLPIKRGTWVAQVRAKLSQIGTMLAASWAKLEPSWAKMRHVGAKLDKVGAKVARVGAKLAQVSQSWLRWGNLKPKEVREVAQDDGRWPKTPPKIFEKLAKTNNF